MAQRPRLPRGLPAIDVDALASWAVGMKEPSTRMTGLAILDIARDGIFVFLKVAGPLMLVALAVGLAVSLVQALTQIQEQTLIYVPKVVAVFAALLLMLPFMGIKKFWIH